MKTKEELMLRLIASSYVSLEQLDKVLNQVIELEELDTEKAKVACQGKMEALTASVKMIDTIGELEKKLEDADGKVKDTDKSGSKAPRKIGVEGRVE